MIVPSLPLLYTTINKTFHFESNGLYSNDESDKNLPYTAIIRLRRSIK